MRPTNLVKAHKNARQFVEVSFVDFLKNPTFQGPNFTWQKFPNMIAKLAKVSCFTNFHHNCKDIDLLEEQAYNSALKRAEELIKEYKL